MIEERHHNPWAQVTRMPPSGSGLPLESPLPPPPRPSHRLRAQTRMLYPPHLPQLIQQLGFGVGDHERSLGRERFWDHHFTIGNHHRHQRNPNQTVAGRQYPAFSLPNIC